MFRSNNVEKPFVYDRFVTDKNFIGRKVELNSLANLLDAGENVTLYEHPKSGINSLVQQTLLNMRVKGQQFMVAKCDLFNVRRLDDFLVKFGSAVIRSAVSTPSEYSDVVSGYLEGTHFVFDRLRFSSDNGEVVSLNWEPDSNDLARMLRLPGEIARKRGVPFHVIISDFQNLLKLEDYESVFKEFEKVLSDKEPRSSFIITGSMVNAMKYIFEEKKYFYRMAEHLPLQKVDDKEIIDYIVKGFMQGGKVIDREQLLGVCRLFECNLWYINRFAAVCDSLSKGFINETTLREALDSMISVHEPMFKAIVDDLTGFQISLVKAVLEDVVKFSASEVIEKYSLNSSANVRRVKDALKKKEVMTFDEKDVPVILDPLFKYWLKTFYFNMTV